MMTPLERAAEALHQWRVEKIGQQFDLTLSPYARELSAEMARIVAEALFPETPEPERIDAMARAMHATNLVGGQQGWPEDGCATCEVHCEAAYAAERKLVLGL